MKWRKKTKTKMHHYTRSFSRWKNKKRSKRHSGLHTLNHWILHKEKSVWDELWRKCTLYAQTISVFVVVFLCFFSSIFFKNLILISSQSSFLLYLSGWLAARFHSYEFNGVIFFCLLHFIIIFCYWIGSLSACCVFFYLF